MSTSASSGDLDLDQLAVAAEEGLARVEGDPTGDEVTLEAGREVAIGTDAHIIGLALVDKRSLVPAGYSDSTP